MLTSRARVSAALALVLLGPALAAAQEPVREVPPEYSEGTVTGDQGWATQRERELSPYHRQRLHDSLAPVLERGGILAAATELVGTFRADAWLATYADTKARLLIELERFLVDIEAALGAPGIVGLVDTLDEQGFFLDAFNARGRGLETLRPALIDRDGVEIPAWFSPQDPVFFYVYDAEASAEQDEDLYRLLLPSELMRRWGLLADTLTQLLGNQVALLRERNVLDLELAVTRWGNYLDRGYSQYPWESLANGWLLELPELGPPKRQWILFHPTLGVEARGSLDELRVKEALNVELVGHLWYTQERDNYFGLSLTASLREDLDPGLGVLFHVRRNWNLGVTWHDHDDDPFLFMSLDLFAFARAKHERYESTRAELRSRLEALR